MAKFYSNRAGCYMKLMEFHRAQKDCEESLKLKPDFVKCWIRKGAVFEALKQHDNALEAFRVSVKFHSILSKKARYETSKDTNKKFNDRKQLKIIIVETTWDNLKNQ